MTLPEILTIRGVPFRVHSERPGELYLNCPFCGEERFRLSLNYKRNVGHCFNGECEWKSGRAVQKVLSAISWQGEMPDSMGEEETHGKKKYKPVLPQDASNVLAFKGDSVIQPNPYDYLRRRGLTHRQLKRVGVSLSGAMAYRVLFPVTYQGVLKMIVGRDFTGTQKPKYLNTPGEKYCFNLPRKVDSKEAVHLTEGVFKTLTLEAVLGVRSAALLGHSVTSVQLDQLKESGVKKVILWSDPDEQGREGFAEAAEKLSAFFDVGLVFPVPPKQVDELERSEVVQFSKHVKGMSWQVLIRMRM